MDSCKHNDKQQCVQCWADDMKRQFPTIEKAWND